MSDFSKYLKYKKKYLNLKGGGYPETMSNFRQGQVAMAYPYYPQVPVEYPHTASIYPCEPFTKFTLSTLDTIQLEIKRMITTSNKLEFEFEETDTYIRYVDKSKKKQLLLSTLYNKIIDEPNKFDIFERMKPVIKTEEIYFEKILFDWFIGNISTDECTSENPTLDVAILNNKKFCDMIEKLSYLLYNNYEYLLNLLNHILANLNYKLETKAAIFEHISTENYNIFNTHTGQSYILYEYFFIIMNNKQFIYIDLEFYYTWIIMFNLLYINYKIFNNIVNSIETHSKYKFINIKCGIIPLVYRVNIVFPEMPLLYFLFHNNFNILNNIDNAEYKLFLLNYWKINFYENTLNKLLFNLLTDYSNMLFCFNYFDDIRKEELSIIPIYNFLINYNHDITKSHTLITPFNKSCNLFEESVSRPSTSLNKISKEIETLFIKYQDNDTDNIFITAIFNQIILKYFKIYYNNNMKIICKGGSIYNIIYKNLCNGRLFNVKPDSNLNKFIVAKSDLDLEFIINENNTSLTIKNLCILFNNILIHEFYFNIDESNFLLYFFQKFIENTKTIEYGKGKFIFNNQIKQGIYNELGPITKSGPPANYNSFGFRLIRNYDSFYKEINVFQLLHFVKYNDTEVFYPFLDINVRCSIDEFKETTVDEPFDLKNIPSPKKLEKDIVHMIFVQHPCFPWLKPKYDKHNYRLCFLLYYLDHINVNTTINNNYARFTRKTLEFIGHIKKLETASYIPDITSTSQSSTLLPLTIKNNYLFNFINDIIIKAYTNNTILINSPVVFFLINTYSYIEFKITKQLSKLTCINLLLSQINQKKIKLQINIENLKHYNKFFEDNKQVLNDKTLIELTQLTQKKTCDLLECDFEPYISIIEDFNKYYKDNIFIQKNTFTFNYWLKNELELRSINYINNYLLVFAILLQIINIYKSTDCSIINDIFEIKVIPDNSSDEKKIIEAKFNTYIDMMLVNLYELYYIFYKLVRIDNKYT